MLNLDIWEDLMREDWLHRVDPTDEKSVEEALAFAKKAKRVAPKDRPGYYGDGHAAQKMVLALEEKGLIG